MTRFSVESTCTSGFMSLSSLISLLFLNQAMACSLGGAIWIWHSKTTESPSQQRRFSRPFTSLGRETTAPCILASLGIPFSLPCPLANTWSDMNALVSPCTFSASTPYVPV
uniref:Secreted protein n=1 Tax=Cacopsylla melanoneura TaxID=428564 RepID=A0A8D9BQK1_9HEMI